MRRLIVVMLWVGMMFGFGGCVDDMEPRCDRSVLGTFLPQSFNDKWEDEKANRGFWYWCEYGLPEWAWRNIPVDYRLSRIVNLQDPGTYFQGLGTWFFVTTEEAQREIDNLPTKHLTLREGASKAVGYRFIQWLYGAGIIIRRVRSPDMGIYTLAATVFWASNPANRCVERQDGPHAGEELPEGAEDPGAGGVVLPPGTISPDTSSTSTGGDHL